MDLQTLDQLEKRITELADRFMEMQRGHQSALDKAAEREKEIEDLNTKLQESQQSRMEADRRIETIIKKLEVLRTQVDMPA